MKSLFLALILTLAVAGLTHINAQSKAQSISVRIGKQKKASTSRISVKFVSLVEDSRCPEGTNCVWAGNAKIKIMVSKAGRDPIILEVNTNNGEKGGVYENYAIYLTELTPTPAANVRLNRNAYTATFSITRLSR